MKISGLFIAILFAFMLGINSLKVSQHLEQYDEAKYNIKPSCCRSKGGKICRSGEETVCCTG
jgi:hypothetical protein